MDICMVHKLDRKEEKLGNQWVFSYMIESEVLLGEDIFIEIK